MMNNMVTNIPSASDTLVNTDATLKLSENIAALIKLKNANITKQTQVTTPITSALVNLKWMNRRDLQPWLVKEEIYGLVLTAIVQARPECKTQVIELLEKHYQRIKTEEADTLSITRRLADDNWQGSLL